MFQVLDSRFSILAKEEPKLDVQRSKIADGRQLIKPHNKYEGKTRIEHPESSIELEGEVDAKDQKPQGSNETVQDNEERTNKKKQGLYGTLKRKEIFQKEKSFEKKHFIK